MKFLLVSFIILNAAGVVRIITWMIIGNIIKEYAQEKSIKIDIAYKRRIKELQLVINNSGNNDLVRQAKQLLLINRIINFSLITLLASLIVAIASLIY